MLFTYNFNLRILTKLLLYKTKMRRTFRKRRFFIYPRRWLSGTLQKRFVFCLNKNHFCKRCHQLTHSKNSQNANHTDVSKCKKIQPPHLSSYMKIVTFLLLSTISYHSLFLSQYVTKRGKMQFIKIKQPLQRKTISLGTPNPTIFNQLIIKEFFIIKSGSQITI